MEKFVDRIIETDRKARESERMDAAYLDAKHALDNAFEDGHDAWLAEITQNTLAAL